MFRESDVILVSTAAGHKGFPKGKRHKHETTLQTAMRELKEETGVEPSDIELVPDAYFDESKNGVTVSIRYMLAKYVGTWPRSFVFEPTELGSVEWCDAAKALKFPEHVLTERRRKLLALAMEKMKLSK